MEGRYLHITAMVGSLLSALRLPSKPLDVGSGPFSVTDRVSDPLGFTAPFVAGFFY